MLLDNTAAAGASSSSGSAVADSLPRLHRRTSSGLLSLNEVKQEDTDTVVPMETDNNTTVTSTSSATISSIVSPGKNFTSLRFS